MRARGAHVTDIVILVVAADDGVMPQTIEAINHAKASGARSSWPPTRSTSRTPTPRGSSTSCCSTRSWPESLGGETQIIEVSATQKLGLDDLIQGVLLQAEVMDLRANPDRTGEGVVIERSSTRAAGRWPPCWSSAAR
jgi:translation initiation factor IF-2